MGKMPFGFHHGDCLEIMRGWPDKSVDLVMCSPPYVDCRTYGIDFKLTGQAYVDWARERFVECYRVCRGLVVWVIEGKTKKFQWDATPILLAADLHRAGVKLRKPPIFHRVGIPGSGGPDWWRNDYEFCICATHGKLPWSNNTATGHPPKWAPGGDMSNRLTDGSRVNQWGHPIDSGATVQDEKGGVVRSRGKRPSHIIVSGRDQWGGTPHRSGGEGRKQDGEHKGNRSNRPRREGDEPKVAAAKENGIPLGAKLHTKHDGEEMREQLYIPPVKANPGNAIVQKYTTAEVAAMLAEGGDVHRCIVGGGVMGSKLAHENEAPYPESLVEPFVLSFCPPGGIVLDPFSGSGTTAAVAIKHGRRAIGIDVRESQIELARRRMDEVLKSA